MIRAGSRRAALALGLSLAVVGLVRAASPLEKIVPRRVDADPKKDYFLTETNGPWLIMASTFTGDGAREQARTLALELRSKYRLPAYLYQKKFDFTKEERGRGLDRFGDPLKMRYQKKGAVTEIAVLVGDYTAVDSPEAHETLKKIKAMTPACLDPSNNKNTSQTLATLRAAQRSLTPEGKRRGPMSNAFIITNPLLPPEYFAPKGIDKLVLQMNEGVRFSLLDCKAKYTVCVATFNGQIVLDQKKIHEIENGGKFKSRLEDAAQKAHDLCEALRKKGVEAYEFHDRYASIVTVGSFDSCGTPRPDGKIEINPAMHAIMQTYGAETKLLPGQASPSIDKPKSLAGIQFDISPRPVEVPRRSIAADYQRATASR